MRPALILLYVCLSTIWTQAQFRGGDGDGYGSETYFGLLNNVSLKTMYSSGEGDGFASNRRSGFLQGLNVSDMFSGGDGDGFAGENFIGMLNGTSTETMYSGGAGDGFASNRASSFLQGFVFPIALISFEAFPENEFVVLRWITESELNNDFFTVERSTDARNFGNLLEVSGAGTTQQTQVYKELDLEPMSGRSYYRLKSTDFDGSFSYSQIVEVNRELEQEWEMLVFPNPNSGSHLNLQLTGLEAHQELKVEIVDMQGRILYVRSLLPNFANHQEILDLQEQLADGSYLLRVSSDRGQMSKLIVVR